MEILLQRPRKTRINKLDRFLHNILMAIKNKTYNIINNNKLKFQKTNIILLRPV